MGRLEGLAWEKAILQSHSFTVRDTERVLDLSGDASPVSSLPTVLQAFNKGRLFHKTPITLHISTEAQKERRTLNAYQGSKDYSIESALE